MLASVDTSSKHIQVTTNCKQTLSFITENNVPDLHN